MNREQHLLVRAAEECAETAQRLTKATVFGLDEVQPEQAFTNRERIMIEFTDLVAVMEMVGLHPRSLDDYAIQRKKEKVERYLDYSATLGTLVPAPPAAPIAPKGHNDAETT